MLCGQSNNELDGGAHMGRCTVKFKNKLFKFIETESRLVVTSSWGQDGMGSCCLTGVESRFGRMEVLETSCTSVSHTQHY